MSLQQSLFVFICLVFLPLASRADIIIEAPAEIGIGADISVTVQGEVEARSFVTLVPTTTAEGKYSHYAYVDAAKITNTVTLKAPSITGEYQIRLLGPASPYPTMARKNIVLQAVNVALNAPKQVAAGARFDLPWAGPSNNLDYIAIAELDSPDNKYVSYQYTDRGSPLQLAAPEQAGTYELRFILGSDNQVIARAQFTVTAVAATISVPAAALAGATVDVKWEGPNNPQDFITIVAANAPERSYDHYVYTDRGNPAKLRLPEEAGQYEIRYLTGQQYATLGKAPIQIQAATAAIEVASEAVAGSQININWSGPGNDYDYITIVEKNAPEGSWQHYTYTDRGNPLLLRMPSEPGEYEIRYATGFNHVTLATQGIQITPAAEKPGEVMVNVAQQRYGGVEVILDASGSMLQRLEGERRIDIAKNTLTQLTSEVIPSGTPFALRVFGREVDSCQTDLVNPLSPLNSNAIAATINGIVAKNNAKTPIADSLAQVSADLSGANGELLVILITDGEETCDGDPAAVIKQLTDKKVNIRINIVGFAIDDERLQSTFKQWAESGRGQYFVANDGPGLQQSLQRAVQSNFQILDDSDNIVTTGVANEQAVTLMPGTYQVRLAGTEQIQTIDVVAEKRTEINF